MNDQPITRRLLLAGKSWTIQAPISLPRTTRTLRSLLSNVRSIPKGVHTVEITTGTQVQLSSTLESNNPKFKEDRPFSEINNLSNGQESSRRLWKTKCQYGGHEVPPLERPCASSPRRIRHLLLMQRWFLYGTRLFVPRTNPK
jgi:hypothetical protein